jgi:lysophospholipase L1-like esterase
MAVAFERTNTTAPPAIRRGDAGVRRAVAASSRRPSLRGVRDPHRPTRRLGSAGRVLVIGTICFLGWALLSAPDLLRNAQASPIGARRTVAIAVLRPLTRLSEMMALDRVAGGADRALGHDQPVVALPPSTPFAGSGSDQETPTSGPSSGPGSAGLPGYGYLPVLARPSAAHPLSVLIVGDSIGIDMGEGVSRLLDSKGVFRPRIDGRESTGLARPDFFNWPNQLARDLRLYRPGVVVAMMGANDAQNFLVGGRLIPLGSEEWTNIYRQRVAELMAEVTESGRPMVWVGMPIMNSGSLSNSVRLINSIGLSEALLHPGVTYVDSWSLFVDGRGRYAAYLPDGSGKKELDRTPDGIHLTPAGGDRLARAVYQSLSTLWG